MSTKTRRKLRFSSQTPRNFRDLKGKKFVKLTVKKRAPNDKRGAAAWLCECECGVKKVVLGDNLIRGRTRSCGGAGCKIKAGDIVLKRRRLSR